MVQAIDSQDSHYPCWDCYWPLFSISVEWHPNIHVRNLWVYKNAFFFFTIYIQPIPKFPQMYLAHDFKCVHLLDPAAIILILATIICCLNDSKYHLACWMFFSYLFPSNPSPHCCRNKLWKFKSDHLSSYKIPLMTIWRRSTVFLEVIILLSISHHLVLTL